MIAEKYIQQIITFCLRYKLPILLFILGLTAFSLFKLSDLKTNTDFDDWFNKEATVYQEYSEFINSFGDDQYFIVVYHSDSLFSENELEKVRIVSTQLKTLPNVLKVRSLTTLVKPIKTPFFYLEIPLIPKPYGSINVLKEKILKEKILIDNFISKDGKSTVIHVFQDNEIEKKIVYDEITKVLNQHFMPGSFVISGVVLSIEATELAKSQTITYLILALIGVLVLLLIIFRNVTWSLTIIAASLVSIIWAMFLFLIVGGGAIDMLSGIIPLVILIMSLTFSIHLVSVLNDYKKEGLDKSESIYKSVMKVIVPGLLSNLTTAFAILSFALSRVESIRLFGIYTAFGIFISFLISFLFILITADIFWKSFKISTGFSGRFDFIISKFYYVVSRKRIIVISVFMVITMISLIGVFQLKVETDVYNFFKKSHHVRIAKEQTDNWFDGVLPFEVVFRNIPEDAVMLFASNFKDLDEEVLSIEEVGSCFSIHTLMGYLSLELNENNRVLIPKDLYRTFYDPEKELLRYTIKTKWINHQEVMVKVRNIEKVVLKVLNVNPNSFYITGVSTLYADLNTELVSSQIKSLLISFLVIFLLLLITFRSTLFLTVGLIPNVVPVLNTLAMMGILGIALDVGTVLIAAVSLGVAIDDTIYFLYTYKKYKNVPLPERILVTYKSIFKQLFITTIIVCLGFIIMATSSYLPIIYLGIFVAVNVILAFLYDTLLLPILLSWNVNDHNLARKQ